jgi:hypothetical protein
VIPGAEAGIQDTPLAGCGLRVGLIDVLGDRCRDGIEMACVEECRAVPQLRRAVAARNRSTFPTLQEIDVALAGKVEAMAVAADERARREG